MSESPDTVVLGLWPHARSEQIEYYVRGYESLYPGATLHLLHHCRASQGHIETVLNTLVGGNEKPAAHDQNRNTLIHLFGDDAAHQVCSLLRAYRLRVDQPLGVKAIVLDSVPVVVAPAFHDLRGAPLLLFIFLYQAFVSFFWRLTSVLKLWFSEPYGAHVRQDLYDANLVPADARKCYIFPEKDIMFAWDNKPTKVHRDSLLPMERDPEAAAAGDDFDNAILERQDFTVRRQLVGQGKEQRWSGDQERYWLAIENAWDGR